MKKQEIIEKIIEFFEGNEDLFNDCIEELDGWNGYLGDNRYYEMDLLNEFYHGSDALEILERAYYGRDDETWHTDAHGDKIYGDFNPNRNYFYYNGYGNLCSANYKDYSAQLDEYAVIAMLEYRCEIRTIDTSDELTELFDALEVAED